MKLKEYIKQLQKLESEGHGDLEIIYAIDDEGNAYHKVYSSPDLVMVDNLEEHYLDVIHPEDVEGDEEYIENAILIN